VPTTVAKALRTDRQQELLRVIKEEFSQFHHRQAHFYLGGGMSTSHILVKALADPKTIKIFWPKELVHERYGAGTTYVLEDKVFYRIQQAMREVLGQLHEKGHLEKLGNTDERRWKPTYADVG
jgi:hypothetical protein